MPAPSCTPSECYNPGTIDCTGSCAGAALKAEGTACTDGRCRQGVCEPTVCSFDATNGIYYFVTSTDVPFIDDNGHTRCQGKAGTPADYCDDRKIGDYYYEKGAFIDTATTLLGVVNRYQLCTTLATPRTGGISGTGCGGCPNGYNEITAWGTTRYCKYDSTGYQESRATCTTSANGCPGVYDAAGWVHNATGAICWDSTNGNFNWWMR